MERGEKLQKLIDEKGLNVRELSKRSGVAYTTIRSMIERNLANASIDNMLKISKVLGVGVEELARVEPTNIYPVSLMSVKIPVLGAIACGDPIIAQENIKGYRFESPDDLPSGTLYYLEATGDSMEPTIPNGSHVLIREQPEVEYGEIAAVLLNGDTEATLKRVRKQGDMIMLMPDNPAHTPYIITEDNPARIIGKAVRFVQDL